MEIPGLSLTAMEFRQLLVYVSTSAWVFELSVVA